MMHYWPPNAAVALNGPKDEQTAASGGRSQTRKHKAQDFGKTSKPPNPEEIVEGGSNEEKS